MKLKPTRWVIILLCLFSPFLIWRLWLTFDINSRLAAIRAAGLPTNGKEADQYYAAVPDNQNAALIMTQAFALFRNYSDSRSNAVWNFKLPARGVSLSAEQAELLRGYVELNQPALARIEEALKLHASRYPVDFSLLANTPLPHLAEMKYFSQLNQYKAALASAAGDQASASQAVATILGMARTLDSEPCLISQLVRYMVLKLGVRTLERTINAGPLNETEITNLLAALAQTSATNHMQRALIGERAMFAPYFRLSKAEAARVTRPPQEGADSPLPRSLVLKLSGFYELDFRFYLATMETNIALAALPPPDNLVIGGHFARAADKGGKRYRTISSAIFTSLGGIAAREADAVAYHRMATTALALERFRNEHHQLPEKLEELVPAILPELPEDPFSTTLSRKYGVASQLEYRRTPKGYILYSVGRDGQDDGGREESEKKKSDDGQSFDLAFIVDR
jgi:hypothetical protein